jgi:hypothetical protein
VYRPSLLASSRRTWRDGLTTICILATLAACGGEGGNATGTPGPSATTGTLSVAVSGLPAGATAAVTVAGPAGYTRTLGASETITGLAVGTYDVTVADVTSGEDRYSATPTTHAATVTAGGTSSVAVGYGITTGALLVRATGLPPGATPAAAVTGPGGFARTLAAGTSLGGLAPGTYRVAPAAVVMEGKTYAPLAPSVDVIVAASSSPATASVAYQLASGSLIVAVTGLPSGSAGSVVVTGPQGFRRTVTSGDLLENLATGEYLITAEPATIGSDTYRVTTPLAVTISASVVPLAASVHYALATGRLGITVNGLPSGANAGIIVTGPAGYSRAVTGTQTLTGLEPGSYVVAADGVSATAAVYGPSPSSQTVAVAASSTPASATVSYAVSTGALTVTVNGLPQAVAAAITITGPDDFSATISTTTTLTGLAPGSYLVTADTAVAGTHRYAATPTTRSVSVAAGATPSSTSFTYALASGGIAVNITGLPSSVPAAVTVTGPGGYSQTATVSRMLLSLTPGTYTVTAQVVQSGSAAWAPNPASQTVTVVPSNSAITTTVNYVTATGSLAVTVNGLPGGVIANVTVTGPNAFSRAVTATSTLTGLVQGTYTVTAATVSHSGTTYTATATSQGVNVGGGTTSSITVTYTGSAPPNPPGGGLNLTIDGMHIQQVVQNYAGTVPIITGRNGLLRVFVKASAANTAAPAVRVRFYTGTTLNNTITINAPSSSVPQTITEGTLTSSWNYTIPSAVLQPGLRILADVDPNGTITESSETDNSFPANGSPAVIDVRTVPTFNLRFVPVLQSATGLQGGVTVGNASAYLADTRALFPLDAVDVDVRAPFTTNADTLKSNDANGAWNQILSEVNALRAADGSTRYYYGIVKVSYGSGIAGLGYVPGKAAIGWDYLPSAADVMAHELGHNFGRFHAPSCGASGTDAGYPQAQGKLDSYGYDIATNALKNPSTIYDLMGYCNPNWVSGYTFSAVLNYRAANPRVTPTPFSGGYARPGLLVWGRVQQGRVILEPTFEVTAPPSLPERGGPNRLQGFGPLGETLFDLPFDGEPLADHPDPSARNFAYVIPLDMLNGRQPTRVSATVGGARAEFRASMAAGAAASAPVAQRLDARTVRVRWNAGATPGVLVRHPRTGEILAFGRGGEAIVHTNEATLDIAASDGVQTSRRRIGVAASAPPPRR